MSVVKQYTSAYWASLNPILSAETEGIETDTRRQKYGDGITAWNDLPYTGLLRVGRHLETGDDSECGYIDTIIDENEFILKDRVITGNSIILKGTI